MSKKQTSKLHNVRICLAATVLALFILAFIDPAGVFHKVLSFLPKLQFWPAVLALNGVVVLVWILSAFIFGRVYCSVVCPLGILQDIIYRIRISGPKKRRFRQRWSKPHTALRFAFLAAFVVAAALAPGAIAYLVEPYSIFGRLMSSVVERSLPVIAVSAITLAIIAVLVLKWGRIWCNTVCPVGTILSIPSRWSLLAPVIDTDKCVSCGLCGKACRAGCIDTANHKIDTSRCILCMDCLDNCHEKAIAYKFKRPSGGESNGGSAEGHSVGRRTFLTVSALTLGSIAAKAAHKADLFGALEPKKTPKRRTRLVPAGSGSLKHFEDHCVACQLCVDACPNHVLRPSMDPEHFLQPEMDFGKGFCRPECTVCSDVCPAGAIKRTTPENKSAISIGHAVFNPELCVVHSDGVKCGNCARHCPVGAIAMVPADKSGSGLRIPAINAERCIGCGRCEYVCPSRPVSAIHVEGNTVHHTL